MNVETLVSELFNYFNMQFFTLAFKVVFFVVAVNLVKNVGEGIAAYILFRFDTHIAKGVAIEVLGKKGKIKSASWREVVIETDEGYLRLPMKEWAACKPIILRK